MGLCGRSLLRGKHGPLYATNQEFFCCAKSIFGCVPRCSATFQSVLFACFFHRYVCREHTYSLPSELARTVIAMMAPSDADEAEQDDDAEGRKRLSSLASYAAPSAMQPSSAEEDAEPDDDSETRKRARMLKKQETAKRSREQARERVQQLERTVTVLSHEAHLLAHRLVLSEAENTHLRQMHWINQSAMSRSGLAVASHGLYREMQEDTTGTETRPAAPNCASLQLMLSLFLPLLVCLQHAMQSNSTSSHRANTTFSTTRARRLRCILSLRPAARQHCLRRPRRSLQTS